MIRAFLYWYFEGRPEAQLKRLSERWYYYSLGMKHRKVFQKKMAELVKPKYELSKDIEKYFKYGEDVEK